MSADSTTGGDDAELPARTECRNGREYAIESLNQSDGPLRPSELADGYRCTSGHMRNVLRDLRDDGEVERVARGEYVLADPADHGSEAASDSEDAADDTSESAEAATQWMTEDADAGAAHGEDGTTPTTAPSEDGGSTESEDPDGVEGSGGATGGIPVPFSHEQLVVGAIALAAILYLYHRRSSSASSSEEEEEAQSGRAMNRDAGGGLA